MSLIQIDHLSFTYEGSFDPVFENMSRQNENLKKDIHKLKEAARQAARWSDKVEGTKTGTRVAGLKPDRGHIGHQAAKMMKRAKSLEHRKETAVREKEGLLASSLCEPAHLFLWDEPLNFIDIFSRIQLEELLLASAPTMLFVEHDRTFREKVATRVIEI